MRLMHVLTSAHYESGSNYKPESHNPSGSAYNKLSRSHHPTATYHSTATRTVNHANPKSRAYNAAAAFHDSAAPADHPAYPE